MSAAALSHSDRVGKTWFVPAAVFALILIVFLANSGSRVLHDPDLLWHIAVGRKILETGSFPWVDEFSHTFRGQPWVAKEWISQVLFALVHDSLGLRGIAILIGCAIALTFTFLFLVLVHRMRVVPAMIGALFAYSLAAVHFLARPHMLSFPLIVLWMAGLVRAAESRSAPHPLMLALMVLWANVHGGFTFGLVCIVPFAIEAVFAAAPAERAGLAKRWAVFLAAAVLASLATPYGYRSLWTTYQVFGGNEALQYVNEWQPLNFAREWYTGALILLAAFAGLLSGVKLPFIRCVLVVGMMYEALLHVRFVALAAIVVPILVAGPLARQFDDISNARPDPALASLLAVTGKPLLRILAIVVAAAGITASALLPVRSLPPGIAPVAAVDHLSARVNQGKVYNDYVFGGYLIFRGIPTFVDGRSDQLFGGGFLAELNRALTGPAQGFSTLLDRYEIRFALVEPKTRGADVLDKVEGWRRLYADDAAILYERVR